MEWLLPLVLGAAALVYICAPLWAGASETHGVAPPEGWHTSEQLELDRELGKIDTAEYEELKPQVAVIAPREPVSLETLIYGVRRQKRAEIAIETEVLIARARKKK
ncbi:MAG TPA: hypothetical protein VGB45_05330 [Abditibacterium sp.]|jgi:hypothetical protein